MNLNLNDPDSIIAWWQAFPERHWGYLDVLAARPQFGAAIRQARLRIRNDPALSVMLARSEASSAAQRLAEQARAVDPVAFDAEPDPDAPGSDELPPRYGAH